MDLEKFTKKAIQSINDAQTLALERGNQQIEPEHMAYALLNDDDGLIPKLVTKCGCDSPQLLREIDRILGGFPSVSGSGAGSVYISNPLALIFSAAQKAADKNGDDFVSVEHIFGAILA